MQGGVCGVGRGRRGLGTWGGARLGRLGGGGRGARGREWAVEFSEAVGKVRVERISERGERG